MEKNVILVNEKDEITGSMEKTEAHEKGLLHRAFSIFVFNNKGEMLIQQRAIDKYHSGGLWTNACCSHPQPGEETGIAAKKRLKEEMGFEIPVTKLFDFVYKIKFDNGLTEYEFDHVFVGEYDGVVNYDKDEVMAACYKPMQEINHSMKNNPGEYTAWFQLAFPRMESWWNKRYKKKIS